MLKRFFFCLLFLTPTPNLHAWSWVEIASYSEAPSKDELFGYGKLCVKAKMPLGYSAIKILGEHGANINIARFPNTPQNPLMATEMSAGLHAGNYVKRNNTVLHSDEHPHYNSNVYCVEWTKETIQFRINHRLWSGELTNDMYRGRGRLQINRAATIDWIKFYLQVF